MLLGLKALSPPTGTDAGDISTQSNAETDLGDDVLACLITAVKPGAGGGREPRPLSGVSQLVLSIFCSFKVCKQHSGTQQCKTRLQTHVCA